MKKMFIPALCTLCLVSVSNAQVKAYKGSAPQSTNSVAYALPRTTLKVTVTAEKETVRTGPYARFAQKFLGVMAPLADKELYRIVDAKIAYTEEADPTEVYILENPDKSPALLYRPTAEGFIARALDGTQPGADAFGPKRHKPGHPEPGHGPREISHIASDTSFVKVPIDRNSTISRSAESMASDAANTIFALRKRRMELITGEAGENVFGEGLKAALREIDRLEQEYLALFLGKQSRERIVKTFDVVPERGKSNMVVCRFTETAGLLPASDLSGNPVIVELTPENKAAASPLVGKRSKDPRGIVYYRIADVVDCKIVDGKREIAQERIPIYQFGETVEIPVSSLK